MAIAEGAERRANEMQSHANTIGCTKISLESSWWGNEKFNAWSEDWWVKIDAETDKAIHVSAISNQRHPVSERMSSVDTWLPKSQFETLVEPQWEPTTNPSDKKGTLRVGGVFKSQYGMKREITGDTYQAFKEDGLADELPWEKTHATFNGDNWEIDSSKEALKLLREEAAEAGYMVMEIAE